MKTAIIVSEQDKAGMNIKHRLLEMFEFQKNGEFDGEKTYSFGDLTLYTVKKDTVHCEHIDKQIEADLFVFATRHQGKESKLTLNVHTPGNWNHAEMGGEDKKLCMCWANLNRKLYLDLVEKTKDQNYEVTLECTHHGPLIEKPTAYIEIGSSETEWENKEAAQIIAKTIVDVLIEDIDDNAAVLAIGGPHYCTSFNKILNKTQLAISHVCPKYALEHLDKQMIFEAIQKTKEKIEFVLLDWKGLSGEKQRIIDLLKELKIPYKRTDQL